LTMAKGTTKQGGRYKHLCMGCGQYFAKKDILVVGGVSFCTDCKTAAAEFKATLKSERDLISSQQGPIENPDDKWEQAWSSARAVAITPEKLEKLPHPIPIEGMTAGLGSRLFSRFLDVAFVSVGLVAIDGVFYLSRLYLWLQNNLGSFPLFGRLDLKINDKDYHLLLDPDSGWELLFGDRNVLGLTFLTLILLLALHRLLFYFVARRTLGQLFAGIVLTTPRGRYPGRLSCLLKGLATTLGDAALVGPVLDVVFYLSVKPSATPSDAVAGLRAVRYNDWKNTVSLMLQNLGQVRRG